MSLAGQGFEGRRVLPLKGDFKNRKIGRLVNFAVEEQASRGLTLDHLLATEADDDGIRY
ncbi:hypothetical protein R75461_08063 [Paraburkholderia nemoris]|uniref:hypothetical protein n=1 Tax=Paraburkholderia nemoris TaxID=2793076 RepID=UPI001909EE9E|nr:MULTISPECIES: hypothetical protein [Paraburkholderia]MBK3786849.1 hypothetical protein [Paraburkholderia aspalathi]CAE6862548.1 hypothetical protein R75461_08063 [Paraburkholderia nemoris]